jgi:hypothetical protein
MTSATASTDGTGPTSRAAESWTARALFARHKAAGIGAVVLVAVLVAITVAGVLSSRPLMIRDASTCTEWGSANYTEQHAYARLYVREHGALFGGAGDPASVVAAINNGCTQAFENDVEDSLTVLQAIRQ